MLTARSLDGCGLVVSSITSRNAPPTDAITLPAQRLANRRQHLCFTCYAAKVALYSRDNAL